MPRHKEVKWPCPRLTHRDRIGNIKDHTPLEHLACVVDKTRNGEIMMLHEAWHERRWHGWSHVLFAGDSLRSWPTGMSVSQWSRLCPRSDRARQGAVWLMTVRQKWGPVFFVSLEGRNFFKERAYGRIPVDCRHVNCRHVHAYTWSSGHAYESCRYVHAYGQLDGFLTFFLLQCLKTLTNKTSWILRQVPRIS